MPSVVRRTLIVLAGILLLIAGILFVLQYLQQQAAPLEPVVPAATTPGALPSAGSLPSAGGTAIVANVPSAEVPEVAAPAVASEEETLRQSLVVVSRDFAERYGSYSSEGDFQNLEALLPVMTNRFRTETEDFIARERAKGPAASFVGVTTRALNAAPVGTVSKTSPVAVRALTQRTTDDAGGGKLTYETLATQVVYTGGVWKVDSARWETE